MYIISFKGDKDKGNKGEISTPKHTEKTPRL